MSDQPNIWNIDELIPIELFVADPTEGTGLTGQVSNITLTIQRFSDNRYWDGSGWVVSLSPLTVTEVDSTNQKGRYTFTLSAVANAIADKYIAHVIVNNPPLLNNSETYELHVSRNLDVRVYESEPS